MAKACDKCGGVWFWSPWAAGKAVRCCSCSPPVGKAKALRGPGILRDDFTILTPAVIAQEIEILNDMGNLLMVREGMGEGWTHFTKPLVLSVPRRPLAIARQSMTNVPAGLTIPRHQWVDNTVVVRPAAIAPVQVTASVAQKQGKRLSRAAKR